MKVINNLFWMDEPRPEWHDPELQRRVDEEEVQPSGRRAVPKHGAFWTRSALPKDGHHDDRGGQGI